MVLYKVFYFRTLPIIGVIVSVALVPVMASSAHDGEEYDEWLKGSPGTGESFKVAAFIEIKNETIIAGQTAYSFKMEKSANPIITLHDLGDEGEYIIVMVQIGQIGLPEASRQAKISSFVFIGMACSVFGIVLCGIGFMKGRSPKDGMQTTPSTLPSNMGQSQQTPPQQFQQPQQQAPFPAPPPPPQQVQQPQQQVPYPAPSPPQAPQQ